MININVKTVLFLSHAGVLHGLRTGQDSAGAARTGLALATLKHSLPGDAALFRQSEINAFMRDRMDVRR